MDLLALNWLGVIPLHTGIATAAHLILRYVDLSLQAPRLAAADDRRLDRRAILHQGGADRDGAAEVVCRPRAERGSDAADAASWSDRRRPSLDDEEEAAMEAKYEAFKAAKEAAEKEAALRASRAP